MSEKLTHDESSTKDAMPEGLPTKEIGVPSYLNLSLHDTAALMESPNYKERFIAEYAQTKIRYERLKHLLTKWEAFDEQEKSAPAGTLIFGYTERLERWLGFKPTCPFHTLREQQKQMGELLHTLELRAAMEGIDLKLVSIKLL